MSRWFFLLAVPALFLLMVSSRAWKYGWMTDDHDQISFIQAGETPPPVWGPDCYGLFRPGKNLIFRAAYATSGNEAEVRIKIRLISLLAFLLCLPLLTYLGMVVFGHPGWGVLFTSTWVLSPTLVSSLVWPSAANIAWSAVFLLTAWVGYHASKSFGHNRKWILRGGAGISFFVSLLFYEAALSLPGVLLIWDLFPTNELPREDSPSVRSRIASSLVALLPCACAGILFLFIRQRQGLDLSVHNLVFAPVSDAVVSLHSSWFALHHLWVWLWPFGNQYLMVTFDAVSLPLVVGRILLGWSGITAALVTVWKLHRKFPAITLGIAVYLILFFPVSNLIPFRNGPYADYYLTLPSLGLALAWVGLLRSFLMAGPALLRKFLAPAWIVVRGVAVATMFSFVHAWRSDLSLFLRSNIAMPGNSGVMSNLARAALDEGALSEAESLAKSAIEKAPYSHNAYFVLITLSYNEGKVKQVMDYANKLKSIVPLDPYAWFMRGLVQMDYLNEPGRAIQNFELVLGKRWSVNSRNAAIRLVQLYLEDGDVAAAESVLNRMKRIDPFPSVWEAIEDVDQIPKRKNP